MSDIKIENKQIEIGENNYRLTIKKKRLMYTGVVGYMAYLSDVNSQYTNETAFDSIRGLEKGLRAWIIQSDILNDPESAVFQQIEDWDGVIK